MISRKYAIVEKKEGVAKVIINDPEKRNRLSPEVIIDLISAFEEIRHDDSIAIVVTTGAGDAAWSAGQSGQKLIALHESRGDSHKTGSPMFKLNEVVRHFPKVTIAAVNGYCLGGAITLLISHDLAIASEEKAVFGLPEILRGFPARTPVATLFRAVPMKWAFDMLLTGDKWDAKTAQKAGLISRIVPHSKLQDAAYQWAKEIACWDKMTLEYTKKAAHAAMNQADYLTAVEVAGLICGEHSFMNPKAMKGMRDFVSGKGIRATRMIKWV